ncbi:GNAT family N-acetyltransferase [Alteromonas sp. CYL-A6]|uniref:GNAT family N-acetyltransferase n=1 Tax=Alteromonas nitratireducens TaxID=3390813 RepID=UPI0034BC8B19
MTLEVSHNIKNMISLWHLYGAQSKEKLWHSVSWPHRVWHDSLEPDVTIATLAHASLAKEQKIVMLQEQQQLTPAWLARYQVDGGLQLMNIDLTTSTFSRCYKTTLMPVSSESISQINEFSALCSKGFGYAIDTLVLKKVAKMSSVKLMLLAVDGRSVATALLHKTERVLGIYQIAVPAEHRGKGYATSIMLHILNYAQQKSFQYACLQASEMGQNLYLKLGFKVCGQLMIYQPK